MCSRAAWEGSDTHHCCCLLRRCSVIGFVTLWTVALQAPLSTGFSRQEYWSGLLYPPPGDLPDPEIKPTSPDFPAPQVDSLPLNHRGSPGVAELTPLTPSCKILRSTCVTDDMDVIVEVILTTANLDAALTTGDDDSTCLW